MSRRCANAGAGDVRAVGRVPGPTAAVTTPGWPLRPLRMAIAAVAAIAIAGLAACMGEIPSGGAVGERAPDYAAPTLDGDTLALGDLRGEVVLVNVWATWCPPCREETPDLQALYERYADDGFRILGISIDGAGSRRAIREFARAHGVTYDILHDPGERVSNVFRVRGVPTSLVVGRDGTVIWRGLGRVRTEDPAFVGMLEKALAQAPPETATAAGAGGT